MLKVKTNKQFEDWLVEHNWLTDCRILLADPEPTATTSPPKTITLEVAYQIAGNYRAYSSRTSRVFRIRPTGVLRYELSGSNSTSPNHWSEGLELVESRSCVSFQIDTPGIMTLHCNSLTIEELPNLVETVEPWISDREIFATVTGAELPTPEQWLSLFKDHDQDVNWHMYKSEPRDVGSITTSDYVGWFVQTSEGLDEQHQGVFFSECKPTNDGFRIALQNAGASDILWRALAEIVGEFRGVRIACGNCEFDGSEWLEYLNHGKLPPKASVS